MVTKNKKSKKKKKLTYAQKKKYVKMASHGTGADFLMGVTMLGGIGSIAGGPGHH